VACGYDQLCPACAVIELSVVALLC
jgi:hypothetical protein